jgi:hypothetical protein
MKAGLDFLKKEKLWKSAEKCFKTLDRITASELCKQAGLKPKF